MKNQVQPRKKKQIRVRKDNVDSSAPGGGSDVIPAGGDGIVPPPPQEEKALEGILGLLFKSTRVDFSHYRQSTIMRRLARRLSLSGKNNYAEYLAVLKGDAGEVEQLRDDLLLSYTEFFRDPSVFDALKETVFPRLVKNRSAKSPIRVWVPGCSTGEEVYSLAICLHEYLAENKSGATAQFFGTDLNAQHIARARGALYPDKILNSVPKERLARYFDRTPDGLKITKQIREMCVFAVQDVTQDPPFPNIDLVSCRNVLIYFDSAFQEIAIPLFHFALKPDGYLLLGSSETMGRFPDLFNPVDQKINLYAKRFVHSKTPYRFPVAKMSSKSRQGHGQLPASALLDGGVPGDLSGQVDRLLLDSYTPPCVLVDSSLQIRQFRGLTAPYLSPVSGQASLKLAKMADEGLMPDIYVAIEEARKRKEKIRKKNITFRQHDSASLIDLCVIPVPDPATGELCFLITFEKQETPAIQETGFTNLADGTDDATKRLMSELHTAKEHLQSIISEKEEVNQELWAANEEVQSTNEELQSVNEEMEAAKEEIESSNEELIALNEELQLKNLEIRRERDFSENVVNTAQAIILQLDTDGRIVRFNQYLEELSGYSLAEVEGRDWVSTFLPREDDATIRALFRKAVSAVQTRGNVNPIVTKDGRRLDIEWYDKTIRDADGSVTGLLVVGHDITERKRAEEALRRSEERFRAIVSNTPDHIIIQDKDLRYTFVANPQLGLTEADMIGKLDGDFLKKDDAEALTAIKRKVIETGEPFYLEVPLQNLKGETEYFDGGYIPRRDIAGKIDGLIGYIRNVTERKRAEAALRRSEERIKESLDKLMEGCQIIGFDWRFLYLNDSAARQGRKAKEDFLGRTMMEVLPGIENTEMFGVLKRCMEGRSAQHMVNEFTYYDGKKGWFELSVQPIQEGIFILSIDITERKRAEEALRESEYFFEESQRAASIGSYKTDFVKGVWESSEILDRIFGIDRNYSRSVQGWLDIVHPDDQKMMGRYLQEEVIGNHHRFDKEYRIVRKSDGQTRWVHGLGEVAFSKDGNVISMAGTIRDVTESKLALEREKELREKLERAARMESLGVLAGGVAHDLNNVLGPIVGLPDLVAEYVEQHGDPTDAEHDETLKSIRTIKSSAQRAVGVVSDLVVMGRRGQFRQVPVDVNRVVEQMLDSTQIKAIQARRPDVQVSRKLSAEPLWCLGSETRLVRVLANLIGNAAEAIDGQGDVIVTTCRRVFTEMFRGYEDVPSGDYISIEVADTGCGMDAGTIARIFEPFFSMKAPNERSGSGLGLSVVHGLVKDHAGFLDVKSAPGRGTTFTIYLPAVAAVNVPVLSLESKLPGGHERILVVDDEPDQQFLSKRQLKKLGYEATVVSSGEEAVALFEAVSRDGKPAPFDLVLTDMIMRGMDGLSMCKAILMLYPGQKFLIVSGHAPESHEKQVKELGLDWLVKPYLPDEFAKALRARLDK